MPSAQSNVGPGCLCFCIVCPLSALAGLGGYLSLCVCVCRWAKKGTMVMIRDDKLETCGAAWRWFVATITGLRNSADKRLYQLWRDLGYDAV